MTRAITGVLIAAHLLILACAAEAAPISNQQAVARGARYAQAACASCHAIRPGETWSPVAQAVPFEVIANTPGITGRALYVWLHSVHEDMPHLIVESGSVEDLWAYLSTLEHASSK